MGFAKNLALFLLGFLLALVVRRSVVPPVPGPLERDSASALAERADCGVLFLGPSYVDKQVLPDEFNDEARRIGLDLRACKYGAPALRGYELRLWLERFLAHDWPRLELVVIDITLGETIGFRSENWLNPRVVEWHTPGAFAWLLDYYEKREPLPLDEKIPTLFAHAKHVGANVLELGKGVEGVRSLRLLEHLRPSPAVDPGGEPQRAGRVRSRRQYRGEVYERHLERMRAKRSARGPRPAKDDWALELRSVVREHDKEAFFLIAPVLYTPGVPGRSMKRDRLVVLDFNDPARYPELYREKVRGKTSHLRGEGSVLYSRLLAREIRARALR